MKYYKIIIPALSLATIAFTGCEKNFLDINDDPNRVTDNNITPELIFPQAIHGAGVRQASGNFRFLNNWMGYFSPSGDFAIQQDETSYNVDFSFSDPIWQNTYNALFDVDRTIVKARANGDNVLVGAALTLRAKMFQELVDIFGNIPYSEAFKNEQTRTPKFDKGADIYADLLKTLDTAVSYLQGTARSTFAKADIAAGGNTTRWIKFANTLRLRLLIRQSQIPGFNPAPEIAKILATGGPLRAGESMSVNPGYVNETGKQSPYYANYGFTPTGADANTSTRANQYIVGILNSNNDPRKDRLFRVPSAGGGVTGTTYGLSSGNADGNHSSKMGVGTAGSATQNQWIMPSFISMFLEAEAIARGWMPGVAADAYRAAVTESFVWLGVPNAVAAATTYLAQPSATYPVAGTVLEQARFIAYQKYIAMTGIDPLEAWSDLRRLNMIPNTGYISVNPAKISNTLPVRLLYPQSEYTTNSANVNGEGSINLFTSKLFWQP